MFPWLGRSGKLIRSLPIVRMRRLHMSAGERGFMIRMKLLEGFSGLLSVGIDGDELEP